MLRILRKTTKRKMYSVKFPYCLLPLVITHCYGIGAVKFERDDEGKHELIALIRDFLLMQRRPFRITSSELCWKRVDFLKLTKTLNENNFLSTPSKGNFSTYWPHEHQIFLVDLRCPGSQEVMERANNLNLLDYPFHWLLLDDDQKPRLPEGLRMFPRSKVYIVRNFHITSAYRLGRDSTAYVINDVATWNKNKSTFDYYNRLVDARNRTDLMGMELNVSMVLVDPNSERHLLDGKDKHIDAVTKVNYPLTLHVIDAINARAKFRVHNTWGYKYANASYFDGMMGDMQNGTAELCASPTFFVGDRIPHIDVIASTTKTKARFIFRAPPLSYVKNVYVLPFNGQVWLACFALLSIVPAIFYTITYWENNDKSFNEQEKTYNSVSRLGPSISDIAQIQIGAICQQGSEAEPISRAGRIATVFLFVAMLFLYTSYSANIVALLQSTTDSVRSLEDLLYSRISVGVEDNPWNRFFFLSESGKVHKAITQSKVAPQGKPDNFMSLETGVHRMRTEYFAFHTECTAIYKVVADTFLEHEKCGLQEIQYLDMYEPYYTVRKNTTYAEIIKAAIRKCGERGLVNRALERIYVKKPPCQNQGGNFLSVSLTDCYAAFLIFGVGLALSAFVFVLETLSHRRFSAPRKLAA